MRQRWMQATKPFLKILWQLTYRGAFYAVVFPLLAICIIVITWRVGELLQIIHWPDWMGFSAYTPPPNVPEGYEREKTLYDWLDLLIIPLVLAGVGLMYNWSEKQRDFNIAAARTRNEHRIAEGQRQDVTLQAYFDRIEALLLPPHNLRTAPKDDNGDAVRDMAKVRSLTALRQLNDPRRNILLQFLRDARLVSDGDTSIIDFRYADLSSLDLQRTDFSGLDLSGAYLLDSHLNEAGFREARLCGAHMINVDLRGALFHKARLHRADLADSKIQGALFYNAELFDTDFSNARLQKAIFGGAKFQDAIFQGAILDGADFRRSNITSAQLQDAASMKGAKFPPAVEQALRKLGKL